MPVTMVRGGRGEELQQASAPQSVSLRLADELDIARGGLIASAGTLPEPSQSLEAELFWLDTRPLTLSSALLVKFGTATVKARVAEIAGRRNLDTLELEGAERLEANDIGRATLRLAEALPIEDYAVHRRSGAFLVIDPQSGATLAAGTASRIAASGEGDNNF